MAQNIKNGNFTNHVHEIDACIFQLYEVKKRLGKGAYGIVFKAIDKKSRNTVAIKKIFDAFSNLIDARRTFREIMFLREFANHPNIIKLHRVLRAASNKDIYLIFEYMDSDLHQVIKNGHILKDIHKRYIMHQLFKAVKFLHSGNVIHRDLKPSNILINTECICKLADFGLVRSLTQVDEITDHCDPSLTDYIATRWYRAPEILLSSKKYTKAIDMWSLGCILGEMLLGKPLFMGSSTLNQIEKIIAHLPTPTKNDMNSMNSAYAHSILYKACHRQYPVSFRNLLPSAPEDAIDLLENLLVFNPVKRLTAEMALKHPYVFRYDLLFFIHDDRKFRFHNPQKEIIMQDEVCLPSSNNSQLTISEYRELLYNLENGNWYLYNKKVKLLLKSSSFPESISYSYMLKTPFEKSISQQFITSHGIKKNYKNPQSRRKYYTEHSHTVQGLRQCSDSQVDYKYCLQNDSALYLQNNDVPSYKSHLEEMKKSKISSVAKSAATMANITCFNPSKNLFRTYI